MKLLSLVVLSSLTVLSSVSYSAKTLKNLDELLKSVQGEAQQNSVIWKQREIKFRSKRDGQAALLGKAKSKLATLEAEGKRLAVIFDNNEKQLAILEEELNIAVGTLGEVFGVVRQVSGDFRGIVENSVVSTQFKGRAEFLNSLTDKKALPSAAALEKLWYELIREMTESGKVVSYKTNVIGNDGKTKQEKVLRIGSFNIAKDNRFLKFTPETGSLSYLQRQPSSRFRSGLGDLQTAQAGIVKSVSIDPTKGALLNILIEAPTLFERFQQGGAVGYCIFIVLLIGLGLCIERLFFLVKEESKIKDQMQSSTLNDENALGRILKSFNGYSNLDKGTVELKLEEQLIKNSAPFEKRLGTIKLFAAIAPLMGLLGTVTGMIATFQSITLFGTGNPAIMAGGISQALITTVLGLICAIPLLLVHNFLNNKAEGILVILEEQSIGLLSKNILKD